MEYFQDKILQSILLYKQINFNTLQAVHNVRNLFILQKDAN